MQFSEHWLRTLSDPPLTTEALAHLLTMSGLEVESIQSAAPPFAHVVVGEITSFEKHPDADRLNVCTVDVGASQSLQIVCGAPNVEVGIKVPCALIGARLPPADAAASPFEIKLAKMRGVESQGMLCSARELKLSDDHGGLLILSPNAPVGQSLREWLDLDDQIFTLKLTPNKADCLSVLGVAREVSALSHVALTALDFTPVAVTIKDRLRVEIQAPDLCGRFSGRIIRGVDARVPTPAWMRQRLERSGQRSVNALVDISNYVMLELGRPTHVFDLGKISGGLTVRWGQAGESLELLNGATVTVDATVGVIADEKQIESLAGVMGGQATAVSLDTTDIYLEAAFWWPEAIRGRARRYNFSTDAAHRFERGVDPSTTVEHLERISALVLSVCGGTAGPIDDQILNIPVAVPVRMRVSRAQRVIGVAVSAEEMAQIFKSLSFSFVQEEDAFVVTAPSYRFDIAIEEDLIEEVARCYGFEKIPAHLPVARHAMLSQPEEQRSLHVLRDLMAAADYDEVINYPWVEAASEEDLMANAAPIRLLNPMASQMDVMRSTLWSSLITNVRFNLNRKASRIRLFEIAKVFIRDPSAPAKSLSIKGMLQPMRLAGVAYGGALDEQWGTRSTPVDFYDVKRDVETLISPEPARFIQAAHPALHPGRSARIEVRGVAIGWIGELHPRWMQKYELPHAPILFELDAEPLQRRAMPTLTEVSRFPIVVRDLALVVGSDVAVQELLDVIHDLWASKSQDSLLRDVVLFDEYRGKGLKDNEKSLAFRFRLQDTRQTLGDELVDREVAEITTSLATQIGATLRV